MNLEEKKKKLSLVLKDVDKQHGKGTAGLYGDMTSIAVETVPTGSLGLDMVLGVGGYPRGRIIEIAGPEASGKTTLTLHAIAEVQKLGGMVAFIDAEHALDPVYAENLGVKMEDVVLSQPDNGEQALDVVETFVKSGIFDVIVVDSVAALVPLAEIDGEMGQSHMGLQARLMSQACRKLAGLVSKSKTILIFINQIRQKIGVQYGSNETTTGGNALKFYSSVRLDIRRISTLKHGDDVYGGRTRVKVVKNKVAPPFKSCEFDVVYGKGVNYVGELFDACVQLNLIEKSGAWFSYGGESIGQGRDKACVFLNEHKDLCTKLDQIVRQQFKLTAGKAATDVSVEEELVDE